jgi:hypothetical protein
MARARGRGSYPYKFTSRRKAALKRAQLISARKRKGNGNKAIAVVAGIGLTAGVGYAGYKINKNIKSGGNWRGQVTPDKKEANIKKNAVSPASTPRKGIAPIHNKKGVVPGQGVTYRRVDLGKTNPQDVKDFQAWLDAEGKWKRDNTTSEQMLEKTIPRRLLQGKQIGQGTAKRAIAQHKNALRGATGYTKGKKGGRGSKKWVQKNNIAGTADEIAMLNMMVAEGEVKRAYRGRRNRKKSTQGVTPPIQKG